MLEAGPEVFNHNIETLRRMHRRARGKGELRQARSASSGARRKWTTTRC